MTSLIVILAIGLVAAFWVIGAYNGLVRGRNEVKNAWSSIDVQLKRRYDLIPNLIETVKGYAGHERQTLEAVVNARQQAISFTGSVTDKAKVENALSSSLRSLFALAEAYRSLRPMRTFFPFRKNWPPRKTRSGFHGSTTMTRPCGTRIELKYFRAI
jgi:LemA protein